MGTANRIMTTLAAADDVTIASLASGDVLRWDGTTFVNAPAGSAETDPVYLASSWHATTNNATAWDAATAAVAAYQSSWGEFAASSWHSTSNNAGDWDNAWTVLRINAADWSTAASTVNSNANVWFAYSSSSWAQTSNNSGNWDTAYGWGNHAAAGYALAGPTASALAAKANLASPTFTGTVALPILRPAIDSTTALKITKADGTTVIATIDTTNARVGLGGTPTAAVLEINAATATNAGLILRTSDNSATKNLQEWRKADGTLMGRFGSTGAFNLGQLSFDVAQNAMGYNGVSYGFVFFATGRCTYGNGGSIPSDLGAALAVQNMTTTAVGFLARGAASQSADILQVQNSGTTVLLNVTALGLVGVGVSPTASLHIKAGTATANTSPLKFTTGTLLTALERGAVEFVDNGTTGHLYITLNVAGVLTRVQIV